MLDPELYLDEILATYLKAEEAGQQVDRDELLARHPEVAAGLASFFADFDRVEGLVVPLRAVRQAANQATSTRHPTLEKLGDYRILGEVGRGGMGIVYEAEQESLGRHVALKVLPSPALLNPTYLERFRREAKAAARLHHTNIVPVFGVGECDRVHFYVMQFIRGGGTGQGAGRPAPSAPDARNRRGGPLLGDKCGAQPVDRPV
jgi:hypothetical protein